MRHREYLGEFEQVVLLALLRLRGPGYGAEIHEEILKTTDRAVSIPAVYVRRKGMERKGLVASKVAEPPGGGRATRNYQVMPAEELWLDGESRVSRRRMAMRSTAQMMAVKTVVRGVDPTSNGQVPNDLRVGAVARVLGRNTSGEIPFQRLRPDRAGNRREQSYCQALGEWETPRITTCPYAMGTGEVIIAFAADMS